MGLLFHDSTRAASGYSLFAPIPYTTTYLINNNGHLVHSWSGTRLPGLSVYLLENGNLLRTQDLGNPVFDAGGRGGRVEQVGWNGNVVRTLDYSNEHVCQHHDVRWLPNGNMLLIAWEMRTREQAIAAGRNPLRLADNCLWPEQVVEISPIDNRTVWEWHLWDHLVQDFDSTKLNFGDVAAHPELVDVNFLGYDQIGEADWIHLNSVAYNAELDQIVLSARQLSEVWVIDHSTTTEQARGHIGGRYGRGGDLLYRWGNPAAYRRAAGPGRTLFGQHDAQWIDPWLPGAGHILLFNNGVGRIGPYYSTVDEIDPPMDSSGFYHIGPDSAFGPASLTWLYRAPNPPDFLSGIFSGAQRLPNGNTLMCAGVVGDFLEVDSCGATVWWYKSPVGGRGPYHQYETIPYSANPVFKVLRYPADYPGLAGRNLEPQGHIEYDPVGLRTMNRPTPGTRVGVTPNPASQSAHLRLAQPVAGATVVRVCDALGRTVAELADGVLPAGEHDFEWDCSRVPAGTYLAVCRTSSGTQTARLTVAR